MFWPVHLSPSRTLLLLLPALLALPACQSGGAEPAPTLPDSSFQLDTTFNTTGILTTTLSLGSDTALAVVIQSDGKILTAGSTRGATNADIVVVRYNSNGTLDTTFNSAGPVPGVVTTNIGSGDDVAYAMALQADGKIVVAGSSYNTATAKLETVVVRYINNGVNDGALDTSFNATGIVTTAVTAENNFAKAIALQTDGKIVVAGQASNSSNTDFSVARYNSNGTLDTTFNTTGTTTIEVMTVYSASAAVNDVANAVRMQADGKIVVAGTSNGAGVVIRLNTDGSLDTTFGNGTAASGITLLTSLSQANALLIQAGGSIVVGGASTGTSTDMALARLDTTGVLDASFGTSGVATVGFLANRNEVITSLALQADGKIVAAGGAASQAGFDFALIRLDANGALDTDADSDPLVTFGLGGKVSTPIGVSTDTISAIAIQADGRIVAAGSSWTNNRWIMAVARYLP